jgi:hypothetical protein
MATTAKPATGNGSNTTTTAPERPVGVAYVRDAEAYHLVTIAHVAAYEAERLCNQIYRAASETRFGDSPDSVSAADVLADPDTKGHMNEAIRCMNVAAGYLNTLLGDTEPPF